MSPIFIKLGMEIKASLGRLFHSTSFTHSTCITLSWRGLRKWLCLIRHYNLWCHECWRRFSVLSLPPRALWDVLFCSFRKAWQSLMWLMNILVLTPCLWWFCLFQSEVKAIKTGLCLTQVTKVSLQFCSLLWYIIFGLISFSLKCNN